MELLKDRIYDFKTKELGIIRQELTQRISYQVQIFIFFYTTSSAILTYAVASRMLELALIIPIIVSIGEIRISFNKIAVIKLGTYIEDEIEDKLGNLLQKGKNNSKDETEKEIKIGWERYFREWLKEEKYHRLYFIYMKCDGIFYATYFSAGVFLGYIGLFRQSWPIILIFGIGGLIIIIYLLRHVIYSYSVVKEEREKHRTKTAHDKKHEKS